MGYNTTVRASLPMGVLNRSGHYESMNKVLLKAKVGFPDFHDVGADTIGALAMSPKLILSFLPSIKNFWIMWRFSNSMGVDAPH